MEEAGKRLGHSILGPFTFYMVIFNWEVWLYIFSDLKVDEKVRNLRPLIESQWCNILFSVLLTIFTMLAIPWIKTKYEKWVLVREYQIKARQAELSRKLSADEFAVANALSIVQRSANFFGGREENLNSMFNRMANFIHPNAGPIIDQKALRSLCESMLRETDAVLKTLKELKESCEVLSKELKATERVQK